MRWAVALLLAVCAAAHAADPFAWSTDSLPRLPRSVMNHAVGAHNGALLVAGGRTATPDGASEALDAIHVLEPGWDAWRTLGKLPRPLMAAAFASDDSGLYLAGGFDGKENTGAVLRVRYERGGIVLDELPRLPVATSSASAAIYRGTLYVVGGVKARARQVNSVGTMLSIDLTVPGAQWSTTNQIPGMERLGTVAIAGPGGVYLIGGNAWGDSVSRTGGSTTVDECFRYAPGPGWQQVPMPPVPFTNAPGAGFGVSHVLVLGAEDRAARTGTLLAYERATNTWARLGEIPEARTNTGAVVWQGKIVVPGGSQPAAEGTDIHDTVLVGTPQPRPNGYGFIDYTVITAYFIAMAAMGAYFSKREKSTEAFFLGGRAVPWWAVGLSIFGTSISSITYLAVPAKAYASDWITLVASLTLVLTVPLITWFYIPAFRRAPINTAYEYLEARFNLAIRVYGSLVFLLFQAGRIAIVLYLPALVLSAGTGLSMEFSILAMGLVTTLYTVVGGIEAVIWTDVVQSIVLVGGALLALAIALAHIDGGFSALAADAAAAGKTHWFVFSADWATPAIWVVVLGNFFAMLYPGTADQTIVQRYLTTASEKAAARAVWTNAFLTIPVSFLFFGLGTALWGYFRAHPEQLDPTLPSDAILPLFVMETFPAGLRSTLVAGVFAAAMSSLSASMNSLASVAVNDYYRRFKPGITDAQALAAARIITVIVGVTGTLGALVVAWMNVPSLFDQWLKWLALVGGGLSGVVALGVFTRRAHGRGAVIGALAGLFGVVWINTTDAHYFLHAAAGFLPAFVVGYLASLVLPRA